MASSSREPTAARPADVLLHPATLVSLAILVLNDQVLKAAWPGTLTGKLSDVAGLIVAPLVLQAGWEVGLWLRGRWTGPTRRALLVAIVATGAGFAAIQLWPPAVESWRWGLGYIQWPFRALAAVAGGRGVGEPLPVTATADAEDLLALPALAVSWWIASRRAQDGAPPNPRVDDRAS